MLNPSQNYKLEILRLINPKLVNREEIFTFMKKINEKIIKFPKSTMHFLKK